MKINAKNTEKLAAAIAEVEGRAQVRTVDTDDVHRALRDAESALRTTGVPQQAWPGIRVVCTPKFTLPRAYGYTATATSVTLTRCASGWFATAITRDPGNSSPGDHVVLTDEAKAAIPTTLKLSPL